MFRAVRATRDWLANVSRRDLPSGAKIERLLRDFKQQLPLFAERLEFDVTSIPYVDYEKIVVGWLLESEPVDV